MDNKETRTEISELGEFGLIEKIKEGSAVVNTTTKLGIGDDAAIIQGVEGKQLLVSTDMLLEGIHFDLSYFPLQHLGYKAVAVNVSDIAAMNGVPSQITVSLGLSNRFSVEAVEALYEGIRIACENYKVDLVGGDTTSSRSGLVISITAIGFADEKAIAKRSGAKSGDIICVTGDLGAAFLGLQVLEREKQVLKSDNMMQPQLSAYDYLVRRQLRPEARLDIVHELKSLEITPTAMIDISDGLASELLHLSKSSSMGMKVYEENLPIDSMTYNTAVEFGIDATTCALNGGEDYELLFTISQDDFKKIEKHNDIHFIGYVQELEKGNSLITKNRNEVPLSAQGWQHFKG